MATSNPISGITIHTVDGLPHATIRDTGISVDVVYDAMLSGVSEDDILQQYTVLNKDDPGSVWMYQVSKRPKGFLSKRELIRSINFLPDLVSEDRLLDWVQPYTSIDRGLHDVLEGKGTPHEEFMIEMRQYIDELKRRKEASK